MEGKKREKTQERGTETLLRDFASFTRRIYLYKQGPTCQVFSFQEQLEVVYFTLVVATVRLTALTQL